MSAKGKARRSSKRKRNGYYSTQFSKTVGKTGKWRGKKWDGNMLLGKSLKAKKTVAR